MRTPLLLTLALLAGCSSSVDRSGEAPPVEADLDSWIRLCGKMTKWSPDRFAEDRSHGVQLQFTESELDKMRGWVRERGTAELVARTDRMQESGWARIMSAYFTLERKGDAFPHGSYADGAVVAYQGLLALPEFLEDALTDADLLGENSVPVELAYRRVEGKWLLVELPLLASRPPEIVLPQAASGESELLGRTTSPFLYVRSFPKGGIPESARQAYLDAGTMIPGDGPWQDVLWFSQPIHYPGCDTLGHTDPIGPPGKPDDFAQLEEKIIDEWMPYMSAEDDLAAGRILMTDPVTLWAERSASAEFLAQVVRVFARPGVMLRNLRLQVESKEAPGLHFIKLRQPLGWTEQEASPVVAAGASESEVTAALASMQDGRAGVRTTAGATVQQLVDTLDLLAAHGATDLYLATLPEGYEAIPKD